MENTFTSIPMMATQIVPGLEKLPVICYRNQVCQALGTDRERKSYTKSPCLVFEYSENSHRASSHALSVWSLRSDDSVENDGRTLSGTYRHLSHTHTRKRKPHLSLPQACNAPLKHIERFEHGTHNGTWQCSGYYEAINRFLSHVMRGNRPRLNFD